MTGCSGCLEVFCINLLRTHSVAYRIFIDKKLHFLKLSCDIFVSEMGKNLFLRRGEYAYISIFLQILKLAICFV